jgi:phosphoribosylformylglycinamidine synthase subunit PurQ / glutaminase
MKFGVITFPGTNCDRDCFHVLHNVLKQPVDMIWHDTKHLEDYDCIVLPGGFSYGDYLRAGAIAHYSHVMHPLKKYIEEKKGLLIGICNGFQILTEAGFLPGALMRNRDLKFVCKNTALKVENNKTPFTKNYKKLQKISIPIAHMEGNYNADEKTLNELKKNSQIVFTYYGENPNGSQMNIAGICNKNRTVLGMMPHPERASEGELDPKKDGIALFESIIASCK